jgi:hypothetical protein
MSSASITTARRRLPSWAVVGIAGLSSLAVGLVVDQPVTGESAPITINGSGDSDVTLELTAWQNSLATSAQPVDLAFFQRGSKDGRASLLGGRSDYAISGVPFTEAELGKRPAGAGQIIGVPIAVNALSVLVTTPWQNEWKTQKVVCDPDDPDVPDPSVCIVDGEYDGPIRIPAENLAAMYMTLEPSFQNNGLAVWGNPAIEEAMGNPSLAIGRNSPIWVNRAEGTAITQSLMFYAKQMAPTAWELRKAEYPEFPWEQLGEQFGSRGFSRFGEDTLAGLIAIPNLPPGGTVLDSWAANIGPVGSRRAQRMIVDYPTAQFREVEVQNKNGDWVLPTREAIEASLAVGVDTNLGAEQAIPGAYPFTWLTQLYTVAGALSPEKANALAASVRFIATDGQDAVVANGGAPLPAAQRAEALAGADLIVESNCSAEGFEVVVGGPGDFEPNTPGVQAIGQMKHCRAKAPTATTTTTTILAASTSTTVVSLPAVGPTARPPAQPGAAPRPNVPSSPGVSPGPVVPAPADAPIEQVADPGTTAAAVASSVVKSEAPVAGGVGNRPRGRPLDNLPYVLPSDGSEGFKKLGTLLLGAAMFLFGRRLVRARMAPA